MSGENNHVRIHKFIYVPIIFIMCNKINEIDKRQVGALYNIQYVLPFRRIYINCPHGLVKLPNLEILPELFLNFYPQT